MLAWLFFHEHLGRRAAVALVAGGVVLAAPGGMVPAQLAAAGIALLARSGHEHEHHHHALVHSHSHRHDDGHHDHAHPDLPASTGHTHEHSHEPVTHRHPHVPDLHHRHRHRV